MMSTSSSLDNIITPFELTRQKIRQIYKSTSGSKEKWTQIATHLHDQHTICTDIYRAIKASTSRPDVKLDYNLKLEQLDKQIESEADHLVRASLIITYLHHTIS